MKISLFNGVALALFVTVTSSQLYAQSSDSANQASEPAVGEEAGYGVAAALANVFYIPAKVTYAGLGILTGGLGYVLSGGRVEVASNIIYPAIGGHYVVTPGQLKGQEPIYFVGPPAPDNMQSAQTQVAPSSATR